MSVAMRKPPLAWSRLSTAAGVRPERWVDGGLGPHWLPKQMRAPSSRGCRRSAEGRATTSLGLRLYSHRGSSVIRTIVALLGSMLVLASCGGGTETFAEGTPAPTVSAIPEAVGEESPSPGLSDRPPPTGCEDEDGDGLDDSSGIPLTSPDCLALEPEPAPPTSSVPAGFEDAFPVTVEWQQGGWTYASTFFGGPSASVTKVVENSPPGRASMEITWSDDPLEVSGQISLDEGRNAPGSAHTPRWALWWSSPWTSSTSLAACDRRTDGPEAGYICYYGIQGRGQQYDLQVFQDWEESETDRLTSEVFNDVDGVVVGLVDDNSADPDCLVKVSRDGNITEVAPEGGWSSDSSASGCVNFYREAVQ